MEPKVIKGGEHIDERGRIVYNNDFNAADVKRFYTIENVDTSFVRAWQGHSIEKRWFSVLEGKFLIKLIKINNWEEPDPKSKIQTFEISDDGLHVLYVPAAYVTSIQALTKKAKLLAMSDYMLGEVKDEYRFDKNYFTS
ncbi:sugar epimerase [Psychroflexus sp. S27]|uniref:sugar epimerase n=1 Tax=Psychroflexus sp. S27 TaxID=1982757 RepID=UPI000C2AC78E|nr:sugar epimerase [Psychroflexus sp. S27]PJX28507.1 sugar epimerase [Psychroflexus sp. S27]